MVVGVSVGYVLLSLIWGKKALLHQWQLFWVDNPKKTPFQITVQSCCEGTGGARDVFIRSVLLDSGTLGHVQPFQGRFLQLLHMGVVPAHESLCQDMSRVTLWGAVGYEYGLHVTWSSRKVPDGLLSMVNTIHSLWSDLWPAELQKCMIW